MNKGVLDRFIRKYNLGGVAEAVTWTVTKKGLSTKCISDDKYVAATVSTSLADLPVGTYHIFETSVFSNLLSVLGDEILISRKEDDVVLSLRDTDGKVKIQYCLADVSVIPMAPSKINEPEYDVVFKIDPKMMATFVKAKGALSDVETLAVIADTKDAALVIGYDSENNSNRASINADIISTSKIKPVFFNANYLQEIFSANKEATAGVLSISSQGLMKVEVSIPDFEVEYFLPNIDKE